MPPVFGKGVHKGFTRCMGCLSATAFDSRQRTKHDEEAKFSSKSAPVKVPVPLDPSLQNSGPITEGDFLEYHILETALSIRILFQLQEHLLDCLWHPERCLRLQTWPVRHGTTSP